MDTGHGGFAYLFAHAYSLTVIHVSIAGASGYTGAELLRWLLGHPAVQLAHLSADRQAGRPVAEVWPSLRGLVEVDLVSPDWARLGAESDLVFLALPHGLAMQAAPAILAGGARVIDLGADFRLRDPAVYEACYGLPHSATDLLTEAVYGLPELGRQRIRSARLVANPGCYPTAAALALAPLAEAGLLGPRVLVDGKSGVSGAGRKAEPGLAYCEVEGGLRAYGVARHRHAPEMAQALTDLGGPAAVAFAPHLVPMPRGLMCTCYVPLALEASDELPDEAAVHARYAERYAGEPFLRFLGPDLPDTKATLGANFCDVGLRLDAGTRTLIAMAALDNLVKGAAGQAIQNMNLMFGRPETEGLWAAPVFP